MAFKLRQGGVATAAIAALLAGCVSQPQPLTRYSDDRSCAEVRLEVDRLKNELRRRQRVNRPSGLASPAMAQQREQQQRLRLAAAQEQIRHQLAQQLEFIESHCAAQ